MLMGELIDFLDIFLRQAVPWDTDFWEFVWATSASYAVNGIIACEVAEMPPPPAPDFGENMTSPPFTVRF